MLVVVDTESQVHASMAPRKVLPAAAHVDAALLEIDPHGLLRLLLEWRLRFPFLVWCVTRNPVQRVERVDADADETAVAEPGGAERSRFALGGAVRNDSERVVAVRAREVDVGMRETRDLVVVAVARAASKCHAKLGAAAVEAHGGAARVGDAVAAQLERALESVAGRRPECAS